VATGSKGIACLDYVSQDLRISNSQAERQEDVKKQEPLKLELEDFLSSISEGRKPAVDGVEGRAILSIALQSCHGDSCSSIVVQHAERGSIRERERVFQYHLTLSDREETETKVLARKARG
jgi:predicted dehydrogenase